uniref:Amino acid permease/ SLC12A domain-containing protein n=1 Tax=Corethron hystrix TaxID=216773 RepID=A0A7S1G022_9STRA
MSPVPAVEARPEFRRRNPPGDDAVPSPDSAVPSPDSSPDSSSSASSRRTLGVTSLALLTYYAVSGGPFGIEPAVAAGGPLAAIACFAIMPLFWSVPEALITAELSSAYPEASGYVAWVEEAFGEKAGLVEGYLSWTSGVADNAVYPVLFLQYLTSEALPFGRKMAFLTAANAGLTYVSYRGLEVVGAVASLVAAMELLPFAIMCVVGAFQIDPERFFKSADDMACLSSDGCVSARATDDWSAWSRSIAWAPLMNNIFWNINYFDTASAFAGEVKDPGRTWPRAMFFAVLLVVLNYLLPLLVAIGATSSSRQDWQEGYLAAAAAHIGGPWLGAWTVFAAALSNLALYQAEMSANAFTLMGMAQRGLVPAAFARRSPYGTPTCALLASAGIIVVMSFFPFMEIVEVLNLLYCFALALEFAAFLQLRQTKPHVPRPYRIPLNTCGCVLMLLPANVLLVVMIGLASRTSHAICGSVLVAGVLLYRFQHYGRRRGWWTFRESGEDKAR